VRMHRPYTGAHALTFADATRDLDLAPVRARFLAAVPAPAAGRARVLDLGCGSGRDAAAFLAMGLEVEALDASPDMARLASDYLGIPVTVGMAQELERVGAFHGIWACASALHVPWGELPDVFRRLARALVPGGALYLSFRWGEGEREEDGRHFTDLTPERLRDRTTGEPELVMMECWESPDLRPERHGVRWLNALFQRRREEAE